MDEPDYMEKELQAAAAHRLHTWNAAVALFVVSGGLLLWNIATYDPSRPADHDHVFWIVLVLFVSVFPLCTLYWCPGNALEQYRRFKKSRLDELQKRVDNELPGHVIVPVQIPHIEQKKR